MNPVPNYNNYQHSNKEILSRIDEKLINDVFSTAEEPIKEKIFQYNPFPSTDVKIDSTVQNSMSFMDFESDIIYAFSSSSLTLTKGILATAIFLITHKICWKLVNFVATVILLGLQALSCFVPGALVSTAIIFNRWRISLSIVTMLTSIITKAKIPNLYRYVISPVSTFISYTFFLPRQAWLKIFQFSCSVTCFVVPVFKHVYEKALKSIVYFRINFTKSEFINVERQVEGQTI